MVQPRLALLAAAAVCGALGTLAACGAHVPDPEAEAEARTPDGWYGDLELARADAARTGRPVLAVFR